MHLAMVSVGCSFNNVFNLFAQFITTTKSHENCVFLYSFSNMAIPPKKIMKTVFYTGKLYGLTGMNLGWFSAGMSTAGTGFCSVAARTASNIRTSLS